MTRSEPSDYLPGIFVERVCRVDKTDLSFIVLTHGEFKVPEWSSPNGLTYLGGGSWMKVELKRNAVAV